MADIVFLIQTTTCIADIPERMLSYRIYELSARLKLRMTPKSQQNGGTTSLNFNRRVK